MLHEKELISEVECVRSVVAFAAKPNEDVLEDNPLGKIPALVLDDGTSLFDSPVICEYLDGLGPEPKLFPTDDAGRLQQLCWQALGDGMTDMMLFWRTEQMRPQGPFKDITSAFDRKLRACFAWLDANADLLSQAPFGIGHIAIICAIGQLDFRFRESHWREAFPALAKWHQSVSQRESVIATVAKDDASPATVGKFFDASISPIDFMGDRS